MNGLVEMIQSLETIAKMGEELRGFAQEMLPSDDYTIISSFMSQGTPDRDIAKLPLPVTQIKFLLDHEVEQIF